MSTMKPHLYINSRGQFVTRHSYSGSDAFNYCARKYYLERVQGWAEKSQRSSKHFGIALEKAVTFWHQHNFDTAGACAEFNRAWAPIKDEPFTYTKSDLDWDRLSLTGQELIRLYAIRYATFPYVVKDPRRNFQVETNLEIFPGVEGFQGLEFTSYIDLLAELKDSLGVPIIIDIKTSGKDVPEYTVLDPQLRSYSWVKGMPNVGFLWFRKMGRTISRGDEVTFLLDVKDFKAGDDAFVLAKDDFGLFLTRNEGLLEEMAQKFIGESKAVKAARQAFVETNATFTPEENITKQRVQFKHAVITKESADEIGRTIKRDMINIVRSTEKDFFPMQSGVRFPNEKCPMCPMRGICADKPDLVQILLERKQLDELDFGKESE